MDDVPANTSEAVTRGIRVQVRSLDRNEENEIPILILDPQQPVPGFYLHF